MGSCRSRKRPQRFIHSSTLPSAGISKRSNFIALPLRPFGRSGHSVSRKTQRWEFTDQPTSDSPTSGSYFGTFPQFRITGASIDRLFWGRLPQKVRGQSDPRRDTLNDKGEATGGWLDWTPEPPRVDMRWISRFERCLLCQIANRWSDLAEYQVAFGRANSV